MAKPPRGITLTNPRVEGDALVYDMRIARWRIALEVLRAVLHHR
jgi:hypothetical protein